MTRGFQLWQDHQQLVLHQHQKLLPHNEHTPPPAPSTWAVKSIPASNAVNTFLPKKHLGTPHLGPAHSYSLPLPVHPPHYTGFHSQHIWFYHSHAQELSKSPHFKGYKIQPRQPAVFAPLLLFAPPTICHSNHTGLISPHQAPPPHAYLQPFTGGPFPPILWSKSHPFSCALWVLPPWFLRAQTWCELIMKVSLQKRPTENSDPHVFEPTFLGTLSSEVSIEYQSRGRVINQ